MSKLGETLISKLSAEELNILCEWYDSGDFDDVMTNEITPVDAKNNPQDYANPKGLEQKNDITINAKDMENE